MKQTTASHFSSLKHSLLLCCVLIAFVGTAAAQTSLEANKETIRRYYEILGSQDLEALPEIASGSFRREATNLYTNLFEAFPDLQVTAEQMIAEGDSVAVLTRYTGTHQGEFNGIAPTGKRVQWSGINTYKIFNGKIAVLHHSLWDNLSLYQQLDVIPDRIP